MDRIMFDLSRRLILISIDRTEATPLEMAIAARSALQREISRLVSGGKPETKTDYIG
jgi:hypothetical protein